jgi:hypothetical protein
LLAGGLLLTVWRPLPFAIASVAVVATALALAPVLRLDDSCLHPVLPYETRSLRRLLLSNGELRAFATANALWEFSFSGLKSFIVLYVVRGLGHSPSVASAVIAVVAVAYIAARRSPPGSPTGTESCPSSGVPPSSTAPAFSPASSHIP